MNTYMLLVPSALGSATVAVRANSLDGAVRAAKRAGHREAQPMIGPMSALFYKLNKCVGC